MKKKKGESSGYKPFNSNNAQDDPSEGYESSDVLMVANNDVHDRWIMDSGCSFHMTPER